MIKQITSIGFSLVLLLLISTSSIAQITITNTNFPFVEKVRYQPVDSSTVPGLNTSANSFWDLGSMQQKGVFEIVYYEEISNHPVFTTATEKSKGLEAFGPLAFYQNVYTEKGSTGYIAMGIGYEQQKKGIGFLSGNNSDTIEVIEQTYVFDNPYTEVAFPLTMGTKWATSTKAETDMLFTIAIVGYNKTPAQLVNYFTADNEVISHGTCRVPAKGNPGQTFSVLMLKTEEERIDSFFINGMPANPFLLAALNINQGDTLRTYEYRFFRENGGMQELARIEFEDNSYSTVKSAEYSAEFDVLSVGDISLQQGIMVYPNPMVNNSFFVQLNTTNETPVFTVKDMAGKTIEGLTVSTTSNKGYNISLPNNMVKGVYFLSVAHNTKTSVIKLLIK